MEPSITEIAEMGVRAPIAPTITLTYLNGSGVCTRTKPAYPATSRPGAFTSEFICTPGYGICRPLSIRFYSPDYNIDIVRLVDRREMTEGDIYQPFMQLEGRR